jgi:hypothetical protein
VLAGRTEMVVSEGAITPPFARCQLLNSGGFSEKQPDLPKAIFC